jgi:hypothetical protein
MATETNRKRNIDFFLDKDYYLQERKREKGKEGQTNRHLEVSRLCS